MEIEAEPESSCVPMTGGMVSDLRGPLSGYSLSALKPLVVSSRTLRAFEPCQVSESGLPTTGMMSMPSLSLIGAVVESRVTVWALRMIWPSDNAKA